MKIQRIKFHNFRIYKGSNEVLLEPHDSKNINLIAGKNGFGKTTFLTSLIWVFYGKMMAEVEEKYKRDIKNAGGYEKFVGKLLNRDVQYEFDNGQNKNPNFSVEIELTDLLIPSIPCQSVLIRRSYNLKSQKEDLAIFIDGLENELTKEVGLEVFINDFILPREIAKFFFFDAEKIVSLAEAKTKAELKNLSHAYSEVLGIKKYEDLKKNLETLLVKLRRNGANQAQQLQLFELTDQENELSGLIEYNKDQQYKTDNEINTLRALIDELQEKLIREGNGVTLDELQEMKFERDLLKTRSTEIKNRLKKLLEIVPLVIAGSKLKELIDQLHFEQNAGNSSLEQNKLKEEFENHFNLFSQKLGKLDDSIKGEIERAFHETLNDRFSGEINSDGRVLLDYSLEQVRSIQAVFDNIKGSFSLEFSAIVQEEKNNRILLTKVLNQIKQAEARKDNPLAIKLREEKLGLESQLSQVFLRKGKLLQEFEDLNKKLMSVRKVLSEHEKNFNIAETDRKKYVVTQNLLEKIHVLIQKIKEDKKYSLQKSIMYGLKKLMHKNDFIHDVRVHVVDDVMDIDLIDHNGQIIDKDTLSKGEQQLYATALLKALVDESGIKFPVFIDSPLQKFDNFHSKKIIQEFYPAISEQVVLFPLLEKELSEIEYEYLKPHVNKVYVIENNNKCSSFKSYPVGQLFSQLKKEQHVYAN